MPEVIFKADVCLRVDAPLGGALSDLADDVAAPVSFSCRSATCGTCRVVVTEGATLLDPCVGDEAELLASIDAGATERLACRAVVHAGAGRVVVTPTSWAGALRG